MKICFAYMKKKDVLMFIAACVCVVLQSFLELEIPEYTGKITTMVQTGKVSLGDVMVPGALMLAYALGSLLLAILGGYLITAIGTETTARIRSDVFGKVMSFSLQEVGSFETASLITRCTNNVNMVLRFWTNGPLLFVRAIFTLILASIKMANTDIRWIFLVGTAAIVALILLSVIILVASIRMLHMQVAFDDMNRLVGEHMSGIRVLHAFNAYKHQRASFENTNKEMTRHSVFVNTGMSLLQPGLMLVIYSLTIAIYVMGANIMSGSPVADRPQIYSDMIEFSSYATIIMAAVVFLIRGLVLVPGMIISSKRIKELLDEPVMIVDGEGGTPVKDAPVIRFDHVSFKYPSGSDNVIRDVSFYANKGETVAFIGNTGCGKTTLLNLIPRLYEASDGSIEIDGIDIKKYRISDLRNRIGYVPQKARLFSRSIAMNIDFGDNGSYAKSLNEIKKAAQIGQADEFIRQKPEGYETQVQQGGLNFSGGQRQRLTISRAVCRDPDIYLFDDSFSALDFKTDRELRKALKKHAAGATLLIVAQRISTIRNANRIYVVDKGSIVGEGTHDELMKTCQVYQEIAETQMMDDESKKGA